MAGGGMSAGGGNWWWRLGTKEMGLVEVTAASQDIGLPRALRVKFRACPGAVGLGICTLYKRPFMCDTY